LPSGSSVEQDDRQRLPHEYRFVTIDPADPAVPTAAPGFTTRSGGFIGAVNLFGRGVDRMAAFAQIVIIAYAFGASNGADLFFLASIFPLTIGVVVGEPVGRAFLTMLVSPEREVPAEELAASGVIVAAGIVSAITLLYLGVSSPLVLWLHPDGTGALGPWLAFAPLGAALGVGAYLSGVLLWQERYVWSASRYPIGSLTALGLLAAAVHFTNGLNTVAVAVTLGYAFTLVPLYAATTARLSRGWPLRVTRAGLRAAWHERKRVGAAVGGGLIGGQIIVLLERLLAAPLGAGSVASLSYARGVAGAPALVSEGFSAGAYPGFVRAAAVGDSVFLRSSFLVWFRLTIVSGTAFAVYFALFGHDIVAVLFQRGRFGVGEADRAGAMLVAFALSTLASGAVALFVTALYGLDRFVGILFRELAVLVAYLLLAPSLRAAFGVVGLAWAFSGAQTIGAVLAGALVVRRLNLGWHGLMREGLAPLLPALLTLCGTLVLVRLALDRTMWHVAARQDVRVTAGALIAVASVVIFTARSTLPEALRIRRLLKGTRRNRPRASN
jgi:putative peptidoglycan lipid II flippase